MKIGLTMFATDVAIDPVELAVEAEARGFSSLWLPEHTHIPVSRETPWPWKPDEPLPEMYTRSMDPISVLSACAHATSTLTLATGVSLAAQHDPITYAKAWATLDVLSNGRARFGVGYGWNREEMRTHGVEFATRRAHAREHVLAMHELWGNDVAQFSGEHVSFESSFSWPKPVQRPRIPTYLGGGAGPKMFAAIAEFGDGWIPHGGGGLSTTIPQLHEAWAAAGRSGTPDVVPFGVHPSPDKLEYFASLGIDEVVCDVASLPRDEVLTILNTLAAHVTQ